MQDQLGSTRLLTSSTGAVTGTYTYDPWGNTTSHTGTATTPLLYAGQYQDPATGFYYLRNRYYDPATAQFLTIDPAVSQTQAPYTYTSDNPVNFSDPTGLIPPPGTWVPPSQFELGAGCYTRAGGTAGNILFGLILIDILQGGLDPATDVATIEEAMAEGETVAGVDDSLPALSDAARQELARMQEAATPTDINPDGTPANFGDDGPSSVAGVLAENEDDIANAVHTYSTSLHAIDPWIPAVTEQGADTLVMATMVIAAILQRAFGG